MDQEKDRDAERLHYHIRWAGKATLDWEPFATRADADVRAKQLVRLAETYTVEEQGVTCQRCREAIRIKSARA
jgi:hypothetical protein